jgi:hypothetical protein
MLIKPPKFDNKLVKGLVLDFFGWAYVKPEYRTEKYAYRIFIEYLAEHDMHLLSEGLLAFTRGVEMPHDFMDLKNKLSFSRKDALEYRIEEYEPDKIQTKFPALDFDNLPDILDWWSRYYDIFNERRVSRTDLSYKKVIDMYSSFYEGWKRAPQLNLFLKNIADVTESEHSFASMSTKNFDMMGFELLKYAHNELTGHYRNKILGQPENTDSAVFDESIMNRYLNKIRNDRKWLKEYVPECFDGDKLRPIEDVVVDASNSLIRARRIIENFSEVMFGNKYDLITKEMKSQQNLENASREIIKAIYSRLI